ncbi:MAG TPA: hypothetical protein VHM89_14165 [Acidimicrobiales bacterium]|nr:hypothetical protein [Acidimicrobiales bacterium]
MGTHDEDAIVGRLRSLGTQAVDPEVAERHASYLTAAAPVAPHRRMRPLMAGAMLAGAVLGGTGLAAALPGSLPEQAGSVAKSALAAVNLVDDEESSKSEHAKNDAAKAAHATDTDGPGKVERFLEGCTTGTPPAAFVGNHGQYVKAHPDDPATADVNERQVAADSDCGKPMSALAGDESDEKADTDETESGTDEGAGKPADAGRPDSPGKSEEEHPPATAAKEQGSEHRSTDTGDSGDAGKADEHRPEGVGPSTTSSTSTTSTTAG